MHFNMSPARQALMALCLAFTGVLQAADPTLSAPRTLDTNGDGYIDRITMTVSAAVTLSAGVNQDFDVVGVDGEKVSVVGGTTLNVDFTDGVLTTAATPQLKYVPTVGHPITDGSGNPLAAVTFTAVTDGASPVITNVTCDRPNGTYKAGDVLTFTLTFNESLNMAGDDLNTATLNDPKVRLTLNNGATVDALVVTNANTLVFAYTVATGQTISALAITSVGSVSTSTLKDGVGNNASLTIPAALSLASQGRQIRIDTTVDAGVSSATTLDRDGDGIIDGLQVTFGTAVKDSTVTAGVLSVNVNGTAVVLDGVIGTGSIPNDAVVLFSLPKALGLNGGVLPSVSLTGSVTDLAGNTLTPNATPVMATDGIAPRLIGLSALPASGIIAQGDKLRVVAQFTEPVIGTMQVNIAGYTANPLVLTANGSQAVFDATLSDNNELSALTVTSIAVNTLRDVSGTSAIIPAVIDLGFVPFAGVTTTVDTKAPSLVSITSTSVNGTYHAGDVINLTFSFSEPVQMPSGSLLVTLNDGAASGAHFSKTFTAAEVSGKAVISCDYTVRAGDNVNPLTVSSVYLSNDSLITDAAGNIGYNALTLGANLDIRPVVNNLLNRAIVIDTSSLAILSAQTVDTDADGYADAIRLTFNRAIKDSTLAAGSFQVAGATGVQFVPSFAGDPADDATAYLSIVDGVLSGASTPVITWLAGAVKDAAGNAIAAGSKIALDRVMPIIKRISSTTTAGLHAINDEIAIQVTFSEPIAIDTRVDVPYLALGNASIPAVIANSKALVLFRGIDATGTTLSFSYTVRRNDSTAGQNLHVSSFTSNGATLVDANGNAAVVTVPGYSSPSALPTTCPIRIEAAGVSILGIETNDWNRDGFIDHFKITFNQAVKDSTVKVGQFTIEGVNAADVTFDSTFNGRDAADNEVVYLAIPDGVFNSGVTPRVSYNSANGAITNLSGIPFESDSRVATDAVPPRVLIVDALTADGSYREGAAIDIAVMFSEPVRVITPPQLALPNGQFAALDASRGSNGNNTSTLILRYVVGANQSFTLGYATINSLFGGVRDLAGLDGDMILPNPGSNNSLQNQSKIQVVLGNRLPTGVDTTIEVKAGDTVQVDLAVNDADGDVLVVTTGSSKLGAFAKVAGTTSTFNFTALPTAAGTESVTATVDDGTGSATFVITVKILSGAAGFTSVPASQSIPVFTDAYAVGKKSATADLWTYQPTVGTSQTGLVFQLLDQPAWGGSIILNPATGLVTVNVLAQAGQVRGADLNDALKALFNQHIYLRLQVTKTVDGQVIYYDVQDVFLVIHEQVVPKAVPATPAVVTGNG